MRRTAVGSAYYENFSRYQSLDNKPIGTPGKLEEAPD